MTIDGRRDAANLRSTPVALHSMEVQCKQQPQRTIRWGVEDSEGHSPLSAIVKQSMLRPNTPLSMLCLFVSLACCSHNFFSRCNLAVSAKLGGHNK